MSHDATRSAAPVNRLARESSPYLLLHAHNPVDWYPWGEEAIERARREDRPIFLSVGYSTCYWCHVMERESFSDPEIARMMNEHFVNVKVDREERPDVDELYMVATQVLAGQGGWPNSLFLTPDLEPFYAGTYFPPADRHGLPGFPTVLRGLTDAWANRRHDVRVQSEEVAQAMRRVLEERFAPGERPAAPDAVLSAYVQLERSHDPVQGGFGGAPKFPTPSNLFLLRELAADPALAEKAPHAAAMLAGTLDAMARGGIYDQLGGGFHRYSTDARWRVPHFEKMLYDNGLLLELYALEHERTGSPEAARITRETAAFLGREMTSDRPDERGAFWSAIDAETHGREGEFYVWSAERLHEVLGDEDFAFLAPIYGFDGAPSFEAAEHVLHLPAPIEEQAARRRVTPEQLLADVEPLRRRLLAAREERERPATDDKVLADWNGMAIRGMALAGRALGEAEPIERAVRAAGRVLAVMRPEGGPLLHAVRAGEGRVPAFLSDYAFLVRGLLALHEVGAPAGDAAEEGGWLAAAVALADEQEARLAHPDGGWYNAAESPDLLCRSQEVFDGATPAANGVAVLGHLELAEATGEARFRERAERALAAFAPMVENAPEAARTLALANLRFHGGRLSGEPAAAGRSQRPGEAEAESVVEHRLELGDADAAGVRSFRLHLEIAEGWHLHASGSRLQAAGRHPQATGAGAEEGLATTLEAHGLELTGLEYPPGEPRSVPVDPAERSDRGELPHGPDAAIYRGTVVIAGTISGRPGGEGRLVLRYQPCDETRCLPPVERTVFTSAP